MILSTHGRAWLDTNFQFNMELCSYDQIAPPGRDIRGFERNHNSRFPLRFSGNATLRFHFRLRFPETLET